MNEQIHQAERLALVGNREATLKIVSAFRSLREFLEELEAHRRSDGSIDKMTLDSALEAINDEFTALFE